MKVKEFDTVLLKDGRVASLVDQLSDTFFIADIGDNPKTWETIEVRLDDIKKVIQTNDE